MSSPPEEDKEESIYNELGIAPVINATGTKTRIGGSLIRDDALNAMHRAAGEFVEIGDLQAKASELIAETTGAESGYVTSGADAGLLLCAAAAIAGHDVDIMNQLPDTEDTPSEIIVPRTHRTGYDHAIRTAGATFVEVGTNDYHLGTGSTNVEPWEIENAITDQTVAIAYIQKTYTQPELDVVTDIAHEHNVPVIVDAAAEVPPVSNLSTFIEQGADMVVFSGGKGIRGPQTTGIVAGKQEYIESIAVQHLDMHVADAVWDPPAGLVDRTNFEGVPRQGIGRPLKVGKEELVGIISALQSFLGEDQEAVQEHWVDIAKYIGSELEASGLDVMITEPEGTSVAPEVIVSLDDINASATSVIKRLRAENPRVYVGADRLSDEEIVVNPMCLSDDQPSYIVDRILAAIDV